MSVHSFDDLVCHEGHHIQVVTYGIAPGEAVNAAIECVTCYEVLLDFDVCAEVGCSTERLTPGSIYCDDHNGLVS